MFLLSTVNEGRKLIKRVKYRAMGFKPGDSLGKPDAGSSMKQNGGFAKASFAPASTTSSVPSSNSDTTTSTATSTSTLEPKRANEPIRFEIRTGTSSSFPFLPAPHSLSPHSQVARVSESLNLVNPESTPLSLPVPPLTLPRTRSIRPHSQTSTSS